MALGETARMGPQRRAHVEQQLLDDLRHYGVDRSECRVDWTGACQEGHCTSYLDGNLEDLSEVAMRGPPDEVIADGWMDCVHGGGDHPLFVLWLFLTVGSGAARRVVKKDGGIPLHLWERLPESTRAVCARSSDYDARWSSDPLVVQWARQRAG